MVPILATLMTSACFAGQNSAATAEYARQVTTANLRVAQLENQLAESQVRIEQLEEFVRVQGASQATKMENLDEVNAEVTRMRGRIEVLEFELTTLKDEYQKYQVEVERRQLHDERRLRQLETMLGVKAPPPPTDEEMGLAPGTTDPTQPVDPDNPVDPANPPDGVPPDGTDPNAPDMAGETVPDTAAGKLELAVARLGEGKPAVARAILMRAATEHADAAEMDEIQYRLAESYFNEKDYRKAALAFKKVMDQYPKSQWAPWALLRQGECFDGLNQPDNAKLFFDGVIQRYPKSEAAKEAKKKLNR